MDTSGYVAEIQEVSGLSQQFSDIELVYTSQAGITRLFRAVRYGKRFMLKCLKPEFLMTPVYQLALRKEFEIGFQLDHPNICRTIGFEPVADLGNAIILEYIDGFTLAEALEQQNVRLLNDIKPQLLPGGELFSAIQYLHSKQVVHRDLKPSNIMITHNGNTIKLIDFSYSDSDAFGILKQSAGTREYIAPEQLLPGAKADVRADIYSLGVILGQVSRLIGDNSMSALASVCSHRNVNCRPSTLSHVCMPSAPEGSSYAMLWLVLLVAIAFALVAFIINNLMSKGYLQ